MRILFPDEKMFDPDGIYNSQNDRIWIVNREEENRRAEKTARKVCRKSDGMASRMLRGCCALVLFEKGTLVYHRYVKEILPVTLRY